MHIRRDQGIHHDHGVMYAWAVAAFGLFPPLRALAAASAPLTASKAGTVGNGPGGRIPGGAATSPVTAVTSLFRHARLQMRGHSDG